MQRSFPLSYVVISCNCICDAMLVVRLARAQGQSASVASTRFQHCTYTCPYVPTHTEAHVVKEERLPSKCQSYSCGEFKSSDSHSFIKHYHVTQGKSVCPGHLSFLCSNLPVGRCWQRSSPTWLLLNVLCCPNAILFHCCHDCIFVGHGMANWVAVNRMESS